MYIPKDFIGEWVILSSYLNEEDLDEDIDIPICFTIPVKITKIHKESVLAWEAFVEEQFVNRLEDLAYEENIVISKIKGVIDIDLVSSVNTLPGFEVNNFELNEEAFNQKKKFENLSKISTEYNEEV